MSGALEVCAAAAADWKLKAQCGHADAPDRQMQRTVHPGEHTQEMIDEKKQGEEGEKDEKEVKEMFQSMMALMKKVTTEVAGMKSEVAQAKSAAQEAVEIAQRTDEKVMRRRADMETEKKSRESWRAGMEERFSAIEFAESAEEVKPADPEMQKKLADIEKKLTGMSAGDPWAAGWNNAAANAAPNAANSRTEKKTRTITFGPFAEDTKAAEIIGMINDKVKSVEADIEEVFAYGKKFAESGAARFTTKEAMWSYMTTNAGDHQHEHNGGKIYCNAVSGGNADDQETTLKVKAMRKVVRAIIEANGGDG